MRVIYSDVRVSYHALVRFCQRISESDYGLAERMILTPKVIQWVSFGATRINNYNGMTIIADKGVIVTVWAASEHESLDRMERA